MLQESFLEVRKRRSYDNRHYPHIDFFSTYMNGMR